MLGGDIGGDIAAAHRVPGQLAAGEEVIGGIAALAPARPDAHRAQGRQEDKELDIIERQHRQMSHISPACLLRHSLPLV